MAALLAYAPGHPARLVLRPQYDPKKRELPLTMVVGVIHGDPRHPESVKDGPTKDELLFCRIVLDPIQRFTGFERGESADGLLTNGGIYPGEWERQVQGEPWVGHGYGQPRYDPYK